MNYPGAQVAMTAEQEANVALVLSQVPKLALIPLRRVVDREMNRSRVVAQFRGTPVTCRGPGCNACCRGDIEVSAEELGDLLPRIPARAFSEVLERAEEIADAYRRRRAPCPILDRDTGLCPIYEHRPLACRTYQVISPPEDCTVAHLDDVHPVAKLLPNRAMALILKAIDEEPHSLLLAMLQVARGEP